MSFLKSRKLSKKQNNISRQKYLYHSSRNGSPGLHRIKFGSNKHLYSAGFVDAFSGRNNTLAFTDRYGRKGGSSYASGFKQGLRSAREYQKSTGKDPSSLPFDTGANYKY